MGGGNAAPSSADDAAYNTVLAAHTMSQAPFDFGMQALAEFWGQASKAAIQAQTVAAPPFAGLPDAPAAVAPDFAESSGAVAELWAAANAMSGALSAMIGTTGQATDPTTLAALRAIADPRSWFANAGGMDSVLARMGESAQLADLWANERQQAHLMKTWVDMRRCTLAHNAVVLDAWLRAGQAFNEAAIAQAGADGQALDGRAMLALWTTTANATLLEAQRSTSFLETQAAMIRAGAELKIAQRDLAEHWAEQFGMPTRLEVDDLHRSVTELRRELRALGRQVHAGPATGES